MSYKTELDAFLERYPYQTMRIDDAEFRYVIAGGEDKPGIIFLNGGMNCSEMWFKYVEKMSSEYRTLIFDYPYELKDCDKVDVCAESPKYAIVSKNGKCGLYDMIHHVNVTEIAFDELKLLRHSMLESGNNASVFFVVEGLKRGKLSVDEATNNTVYVWTEDE